jgi:hypothetical protein
MPNGDDHFSFPVGVPMVIYPVLAIGINAGAARWWGIFLTVVTLAIAVVFTWEAFSERELKAIQRKDASMNRPTWRFNWLMFFALPGYCVALWGVAAISARW